MALKRLRDKELYDPSHKTANAKVERKYFLVLLCILLFAVAYSIIFVDGPSFYGDDVTYLNLAYNVLHGNFVEGTYIFSVRLLQVLPIALFYKLFGVSLLTDSAWNILSFLGIITVSFFMAKELFGNLAGAISALLAAFFPLVVVYSSTIGEDIPLAFLTSLALLSLLYAQRRNSGKWYMLSGILLVASFLISPEAAIVGVIVLLYLIVEVLSKKITVDRTSIHIVYGIAIALIVLMAFNYFNSQNPLITFDVNFHFYSAVGQPGTIPSTNSDPMFYFGVMFPYQLYSTISSYSYVGNSIFTLFAARVVSADQTSSTGFYFYALVIALLYLIATREKKAYFALFFFLAGFLYLEFGPMHVSLFPFEYILSYRLDRFMMIIAVPAMVLMGIAISKFIEENPFRNAYITSVTAFLIIAFLILTSIPINLNWHQVVVYQRYDQMAISSYLLNVSSSATIYYPNSDPSINIYAQFKNNTRFIPYWQFTNCTRFKAGSYVVVPRYPSSGSVDNATSCTSWQLIFAPPMQDQFPQWIQGEGKMTLADLYYVR